MYVYILLTRSRTILSKFIYAISGMKYTHASISLMGPRHGYTSYTRKDERFILPAGWARERVDFSTGVIPYALYRIEVTPEQMAAASQAVKELRKYPFDITGLFNLAIRIEPSAEDAYFCSQYVSAVLRRAGIHAFKRPDYAVRPIDFMLIDNAELIETGMLNRIGARHR